MKSNLPVLLLKNMVLFPYNEIRIELDSSEDKKIISLAESCYDNKILIVNPKDTLEISPEIDELPNYGIVGKIKMKLDMPNGKTRIIILGESRVKVFAYSKDDGIYEALFSYLATEELSPKEEMAYVRALNKHIDVYVHEVPYMSNTILSQTAGINDIDKLTDIVVLYLPINYERKQEYLKETSSTSRVKMILDDISSDIEILKLEQDIELSVANGLEESQKEFVLREKIKAIKKELGEESQSEIEILRDKIDALDCPKKVKEKLNVELNKYEMSNSMSPETGMIRTYIDWLLNLPWTKTTEDRKDLKKVREILDSTHYGLENVKDRVIEYLAVKQKTDNLRSPIICLVGPPGVGKTTFAKNVAKSINRKVTKISVGGINDEAEIIGHRRAYVGSAPGLIIQGMKKAGVKNPVFIIDEIDKMTKDIKGDPASSLLEVLDKEQNKYFTDHYLEEEFDLSSVMFIATANYLSQIPEELRDRLEIIEVSSYTEFEKLDIAKRHLIIDQLKEHGLKDSEVEFTDEAILTLVRNYTKESGVRELDRLIATILRKIVKKIVVDKEKKKYIIDSDDLEEYLGIKKFLYNDNIEEDRVGIVNGLAYTIYGGDILPIEATIFDGTEELILTGSLGEVMQESAKIALDYVKSNHDIFNINLNDLKGKTIHIHVPEGAIQKEGPSAGVAITTVLISLLTKLSVSSKTSMTGEITLTGRVLPIGGLKEKVIGAYRAMVNKIFIPRENEKDLKEIPDEIKDKIEFILVDNYLDIFKNLGGKKDESRANKRSKNSKRSK
ncbi:MAG: endopeptidase La [Bacilli bacterium]|nr:endopeptidase La [Bacilli bacterium]